MKPILLLVCISILTSCASLTNTQKTLAMMAGAAAVGSIVGASLTPKDENAGSHAALWGGIAAASAGLVGLYVNSDQERVELQAKQIEALKRELNASEHGRSVTIATSESALEKTPPKEFQGLIRNGGWEFSSIDEWEKISDTEAVHKDKRALLIPAQFNFGK